MVCRSALVRANTCSSFLSNIVRWHGNRLPFWSGGSTTNSQPPSAYGIVLSNPMMVGNLNTFSRLHVCMNPKLPEPLGNSRDRVGCLTIKDHVVLEARMPLFFFDYRGDDGCLERDEEGIEFPSVGGRRKDAIKRP